MDGGIVEIWEGIADGLLRATGLDDPPQDAFALAACCGLDARPWARSGGLLEGDLLYYPANARETRQHGIVAHELGHWALDWADEEQSEQGANYIAGALMLPRRAYDRDLRETAWDLDALRARHPNASAEMCARRIAELRDAVITIVDDGRVTARIRSPWAYGRSMRMTQLERYLANAAMLTGETQRANALLAAHPLFDGKWRRVIVIADAEQLSLRL